MNLSRVALAGFAAWVVFCIVGFVAHAVLMDDLYAAHSAIMRPPADADARLPLSFAVALLGFFAFAYAYAKGYEGGAGIQEGLRFGVLIGVMLIAFVVTWDYMTYPLSRTFLFALVIDYIVEYAIYGAVVGMVYRPRVR
jgi:prepilin signal peptidase PulO-like enzyme (type II secretory pathway)